MVPLALARRVARPKWNLGGNLEGPGITDAGTMPESRTDGGGLWLAQWPDIHLRRGADARTFGALRMRSSGSAAPIVVPCLTPFQPALILSNGRRLADWGDIPHDDGSVHDDGSGYDQPLIVAEAVNAAALRATSLTIAFEAAITLKNRECFSVLHADMNWRLYEINWVETDLAGHIFVKFLPPLRQAIAAGEPLEFDNPRCVMKVEGIDGMEQDIGAFPYGPVGARFRETFEVG